MSGTDVDLAALATMASTLDAAAADLDSAADSSPGSVDAGPMTPVVSAMLSQITNSAGNVSTAMGATADIVRDCRSYYQQADANADARMTEIQSSMESGS